MQTTTLKEKGAPRAASASVGDVISGKYIAPASEQNGYYDRIYEKLAMVEP